MEDEQETAYLRHRRRKSSMSLSCCFPGHSRRFNSADSSSSSSPMMSPVSSWFRSKGQHELLPEEKGKSPRNFMSRMGGGRHARRHSGDFSYDPLSYSLNFDTSSNAHFDDFTSRLPVSPPRRRPSLSAQIRNLDLSSPRNSAPVPKVRATSTMQTRNAELLSPQKPAAVPKVKATEMAAAGGNGTVDRTLAVTLSAAENGVKGNKALKALVWCALSTIAFGPLLFFLATAYINVVALLL